MRGFSAAFTALILSQGIALTEIRATVITASDGATTDYFGYSVSLSGDSALAGACLDDATYTNQGSAYFYKDLDSNASGTTTQNVKLTASDAGASDTFGISVSLSGDSALVGASGDDATYTDQGSAYYYKDLDSNDTGTAKESVKLSANDAAGGDRFGCSVSLSGDSALVGAYGDESSQGSAYYYTGLSSAGTTAKENVKLTASDGAADDRFGCSVSLSDDSALVGAYKDDATYTDQGSAYYYKNLDSNDTGTAKESVKLTASDAAASDYFGASVSLSGDSALVGAYQDDATYTDQGSAYYYKNLDSNDTGTAKESVKLTASDGAEYDNFGYSVSISGDNALVSACGDDDKGSNSGSAYYYRDLDSASSTATQSVKLTASDSVAYDYFGTSVSLSGDNFTIGACYANSNIGKAYTGTISSITTLDVSGGASRTISGISFVSQTDWIIGSTYSSNTVTQSSGDSATVTATGCAVYIGQNSGSNNNTLVINGTLTATNVYVGAAGNSGNILQIGSGATEAITKLYLAAGNTLEIYGDYTATDALTTYLYGNSTTLYVVNSGVTTEIASSNYATYLLITSSSGYTLVNVGAVPEPATCALFGGLGALGLAFFRRRVRC
jgi:hypothetical protein